MDSRFYREKNFGDDEAEFERLIDEENEVRRNDPSYGVVELKWDGVKAYNVFVHGEYVAMVERVDIRVSAAPGYGPWRVP